MSKRKKAINDHPIFIAVDRHGLPLEEAILHAAAYSGWSADAAIFDFLLGAGRAGWSRRKVRSDVRDALRGIKHLTPVDERWLFWADGAFDGQDRQDGNYVNATASPEVQDAICVAEDTEGQAAGPENLEGVP